MATIKKPTPCDLLNQRDIGEYLSSQGFQPANDDKVNEHWYHSPINLPDKTPSFKIDRVTNTWYDFSKAMGGTLIDLGIILHQCSVKDFLHNFSDLSALPIHIPPPKDEVLETISSAKNEVMSVTPLKMLPLLGYIASRGIPRKIADQYCKEVHYKNGKGQFYGIGFENDKGGFEIRSRDFKGGTIPKDVTHIYNSGSLEISVFEGFFSFMSFVALNPKTDHSKKDYLILNSLTQFEKGRKIMEAYDHINLYLDRDKSGMDKTAYALKLNSQYKDKSGFYEGYKDTNKFLTNEPLFQKQQSITRSRSRA
jgi:hypothetical protein